METEDRYEEVLLYIWRINQAHKQGLQLLDAVAKLLELKKAENEEGGLESDTK